MGTPALSRLGQGDRGPEYESPTKRWLKCGSGLAGLHLKSTLKELANPGRGQTLQGQQGSKMSMHQNRK